MRLTAEQQGLARRVIQALLDDWMLVEEDDDDTHLILVDEDRTVMEDLRPRRDFITLLEQQGFVTNFGIPLDAPPAFGEITHTYLDGRTETAPFRLPHVFDFRPTKAGLALVSS